MKMIETSVQITKNFHSSEFACKDSCKKIYIAEELVQKLQKLRDHFNKPINISSGYRCKNHNKNIGGSETSPHCLGVAADLCVSGYKSIDIAKIAEKIGFDGIALINDEYIHLDLKGRKWYADERTGEIFNTFNENIVKESTFEFYVDGVLKYKGILKWTKNTEG